MISPILLVFLSICSSEGINISRHDFKTVVNVTDVGLPLFLTPLIEKGMIERAQQLSQVSPKIGNITSYSGFLTVNKECDSNLFFWFFPAQKTDWKKAPLVLWVEGGPGGSSLEEIFYGMGPFEFQGYDMRKRELTWNDKHNLLFIEQPVGVGYSFTKNESCYAKDEIQVGTDLYEAVAQLHVMFPEFQRNKFIISGSSYGGHYIPGLGHAILRNKASARVKINLAAMMIGNGLMEFETQIVDYGSYLYEHGLISYSQKENLTYYENQIVELIKSKNWAKAYDVQNYIYWTFVSRLIGSVNRYNYLNGDRNVPDHRFLRFVKESTVRKAIHVGNLSYNYEINPDNFTVYINLEQDIVRSVRPFVQELLEEYPIIFYYGQLDTVCPYPMMINFLRALSWSGEKEYLNATRTKWCVGNTQAGYFKGSHNLYDVLVRNAGHSVTSEQSYWAYVLVNSVTSGSPANPLHLLTAC